MRPRLRLPLLAGSCLLAAISVAQQAPPTTRQQVPQVRVPMIDRSKIAQFRPLSDLVGSYAFAGNADDSSLFKNHGILHGPVFSSDQMGRAMNALSFDGVDDYVEIPQVNGFSLQGFTVAMWIRSDQLANVPAPGQCGSVVPVSMGGSGKYWWLSLLNCGGSSTQFLGFAQSVSGGNWSCCDTTTAMVPHTYHHVALTYQRAESGAPGEIKIYVDGKLEGSADNVPPSLVDGTGMWLGQWGPESHPGASRFQGKMDQLQLYRRVLTESEIQALAASEDK